MTQNLTLPDKHPTIKTNSTQQILKLTHKLLSINIKIYSKTQIIYSYLKIKTNALSKHSNKIWSDPNKLLPCFLKNLIKWKKTWKKPKVKELKNLSKTNALNWNKWSSNFFKSVKKQDQNSWTWSEKESINLSEIIFYFIY